MKIFTIGCGRWGSFIAWYLDSVGHEVTLYGKSDAADIQQFIATRTNGVVTMPETMRFSTELADIQKADAVVISIGSQGLSSLMREIDEYKPENKVFILCMKGIEIGTGKRLSEIVEESVSPTNKIAVWLGPGHPQEFVAGRQECPWASAGGFIGSFDSKNKSTVSFAVNSSADATVKLIFCIANTASYTIFFEDWNGFLKINNMNYEFDTDDIVHDRNIAKGERYADMYPAFASTAPYLMFEAVEVEIELNKGYNTITFTGGSVTFNFDYIEIIPESDNIRIS